MLDRIGHLTGRGGTQRTDRRIPHDPTSVIRAVVPTRGLLPAPATFGLLVVLHGLLVAALTGRYGQSLPMLATPPRTNPWRTVVRYWPLVPLVVLFPLAILSFGVGLVVLLGSRLVPSTEPWLSRPLLVAGRVLLVAAAVASLPSFVSAASTILAAS